MYLICLALWYLFFAPVQFVIRTGIKATKVALLMTCVAVGAYIVGCFTYGVYLGLHQ